MRRTIVLAILDGWGIGELNESNPIYKADPQNIKNIERFFPNGALQASGIAIGLPWEEEGNSEVGHLTIGAGKVFYQHYPRISMTIDDGSFFKNARLSKTFDHARKNNSAVNLVGLLTDGNIHASLKHLVALLEMAKREKIENVYLHLFADGRDSQPRSLIPLLKKMNEEIQKLGVGKIASLAGRYYAMDRDKHWDRTEKVYRLLVGENQNKSTPEEETRKVYDRELNDEFIEPFILPDYRPITDNDAVIFFNFREDRTRQIIEPLLNPNFEPFAFKTFQNLFVTTMTEYKDEYKNLAVFPTEKIDNSLAKVLADNKKIQLHIAETEKYAHITYFFNGLREKAFPNEYRILVPSKTAIRQEDYPEMMAGAITDRTIMALNEGGFDFILINYANPDIIAHTGNYEATLRAIKIIDEEIGKLVKSVLAGNHILIITSDHGNAESLLNLKTGEPETFHDPNPVPIYLVAKEFQKQSPAPEDILSHLPVIGILSDIAPTILELMNIPKPQEMTGQSLLPELLK